MPFSPRKFHSVKQSWSAACARPRNPRFTVTWQRASACRPSPRHGFNHAIKHLPSSLGGGGLQPPRTDLTQRGLQPLKKALSVRSEICSGTLARKPFNPQPLISHLTNSNECGNLQIRFVDRVPVSALPFPRDSTYVHSLPILATIHSLHAKSFIYRFCAESLPNPFIYRIYANTPGWGYPHGPSSAPKAPNRL